ncbi:MAG: hypothetical protein AMJ91_03075 [candidate division Zixibacteria bacterium SM23_73_3]|nr:MAG: hypothetical protein AMJ91_03075 [candidate division Zixibacteria bacterium SM23_73_3]
MKIKDFLHLGYESQIRISLIFFILFLILFNFGTEYLFHQTKHALKLQTHQYLSTVAHSASLIWERNPQSGGSIGSALKKNLMELSYESGVNRISYISLDGEALISSREVRSAEELHIFRGVKPDKVAQGKFFSDFYTDVLGNTYLSCYLPLEGKEAENSIWVMVEKEVSAFASIEKVSRLNVLARIGGLFIAAFVTLLLIKNLLRPYRLMVKKAKKEMIIPASEKSKKEGELDVAVGIFEQVIAELKQKERTLQELYQKTDRKAKNLASYNEYILKSMTNGMIITDEEGKITRMNHPAEMILKKSENMVLGKHYRTVFGEESPLCSAIQIASTEQSPYSIPEIKITKKGGKSIPLSLSSSVVKDERSRMLGVVVFLTDLTEIKKLEEEIAFKDKMAALGEMSSGLAHELRNSMGTILGFSKLLKKGKDDPSSQSQTVDGITNEAMIMESLLKRFLAFAKPLQLKIKKINLKEILEECHTSVKETLKENRIKFKLDCESDLPTLLGDPILLKQCFQNLIQNSIEAMPDGGEIRILIGEKQFTSGEKSVLVEFSDTGWGIAKEVQDKIFNPFFTSREKGTGLGLSLVKKIVSLHDGKIEVESEPDKGTTFKIHLPSKLTPHLTPVKSGEKGDLESLIYSHSTGVNESSEGI